MMEAPMLRILAAAACAASLFTYAAQASAPDCPNAGMVRFGVVPGEDTMQLGPIYDRIGKLLAERLDCGVAIQFGTNYTATIEAMRSGRVEIGVYGAFSYVLAHQVAGAEAVAGYANADGKPSTYTASIVTWPGTGITSLKDIVGKSFAFSDPASTSGHLIPAYGLRKNGIDPDYDIKPIYTGTHTASFEAIRNHKVLIGEMNSTVISAASVQGIYHPDDYVRLWLSDPIPGGPFAIRSNLQPGFKSRLTEALRTLDLTSLPERDMKILGRAGSHGLVAVTDADYNGIRDVVQVLHIDLSKMNE
jgi:phosphonate transport system substrate-binding protein